MKRSKFIKVSALSIAGIPSIYFLLKEGKINEENFNHDQDRNRLKWFEMAKFGLFIHWGLYSVPSGEWNGKKTKLYRMDYAKS